MDRALDSSRHPALILTVALALTWCLPRTIAQSEKSAHTPAPRITVIGVSNFAKVTPDLYRGGQPRPVGYANLKKMGVDIVVDLRLSKKGGEKKNVTKAGMSYVAIPWHCLFPKDKDFEKFLLFVRENRDKKIFVHCRYGDDRTGMMIAAYRMAVQAWTPKEAREEMDKFGFHRVVCASLVGYEEHFPEHLQRSDDFKAWREATGAASSK